VYNIAVVKHLNGDSKQKKASNSRKSSPKRLCGPVVEAKRPILRKNPESGVQQLFFFQRVFLSLSPSRSCFEFL